MNTWRGQLALGMHDLKMAPCFPIPGHICSKGFKDVTGIRAVAYSPNLELHARFVGWGFIVT